MHLHIANLEIHRLVNIWKFKLIWMIVQYCWNRSVQVMEEHQILIITAVSALSCGDGVKHNTQNLFKWLCLMI
ncbi:hypothetical protein BTO21_00690 [Photobacterium phosphoreum]|nr:hypothetical protein UB41_19820 [Photobacterium phosphoreum]PQJ90305.1 hypothetical protein BTO21_00690 [Photobacterium phosphoreum]PSV71993.1 hypothetical protein CTM77_06375 [Photobacterium phosphoreum]